MPLDHADIQRVALLARLEVPPEREAELIEELGAIVDFMVQLDELPLDAPRAVHEVASRLRDDRVAPSTDPDRSLADAPRREGLVCVPPVLQGRR